MPFGRPHGHDLHEHPPYSSGPDFIDLDEGVLYT